MALQDAVWIPVTEHTATLTETGAFDGLRTRGFAPEYNTYSSPEDHLVIQSVSRMDSIVWGD